MWDSHISRSAQAGLGSPLPSEIMPVAQRHLGVGGVVSGGLLICEVHEFDSHVHIHHVSFGRKMSDVRSRTVAAATIRNQLSSLPSWRFLFLCISSVASVVDMSKRSHTHNTYTHTLSYISPSVWVTLSFSLHYYNVSIHKIATEF